CNQCGYRTFSTFKLENHARIHSEERDFTCAQCGKGFKQLSQLRNHHVVKPYVCSFCGHMSARKAMLQLHLRQHTGEKPFACHQCDYRTGDHNSLRRHKMRHTGTKPYKCPHCPYACIQVSAMQAEEVCIDWTPSPQQCGVGAHCPDGTAPLPEHTAMFVLGDIPEAMNQVCVVVPGDAVPLLNVIAELHTFRIPQNWPSPCMPLACATAISYKMHMKNKHPGLEGLFACSLCNFRSVSKENFTNHMSDHKRGILATSANIGVAATSVSVDGQSLQLPEGTLQQLEGILPGNLNAAQLIYSCLSALQQEGGPANLPPGVTTYSAGDGTQTITIQV
ncbi:unnamed protein product, partial [Ixodes persulcatus]